MTPFLFIFESIGTQELLLIGIIALIFLGPRRMPDMARKLGKMMSEFRNATSEFKTTWEREVNFEEETNALKTGDLADPPEPIPRENSILPPAADGVPEEPSIRPADPSLFDNLELEPAPESTQTIKKKEVTEPVAKENWL